MFTSAAVLMGMGLTAAEAAAITAAAGAATATAATAVPAAAGAAGALGTGAAAGSAGMGSGGIGVLGGASAIPAEAATLPAVAATPAGPAALPIGPMMGEGVGSVGLGPMGGSATGGSPAVSAQPSWLDKFFTGAKSTGSDMLSDMKPKSTSDYLKLGQAGGQMLGGGDRPAAPQPPPLMRPQGSAIPLGDPQRLRSLTVPATRSPGPGIDPRTMAILAKLLGRG